MVHIQPLVYIVVINYNNFEDTIECIKSLNSIYYKNKKILIVDNYSKNNSVKELKAHIPSCDILQLNENLGFAGGNNVGIKKALELGADYVLLINNDTTVNKDFLDKMVEVFYKYEDVGIVGGKILNYYNKNLISHAGGNIDLFKYTTTHYGLNKFDSSEYNTEREVGFISGCLMLIKSEIFKSVGLLPEEYFMYYEDTDYCLNVRENGYKLIYSPKAIIYHKVSASSGGEESPFFLKWNTRNRLLFMNKYKYKVNIYKFWLSKIYFYLTRVSRFFFYLINGKKEEAKSIIQGIIDYYKYK